MTHKFKEGDKVRFKSSKSTNAHFFRLGLRNLTIYRTENSNNPSYVVLETDGLTTWFVKEDELELEKKSLKELLGE